MAPRPQGPRVPRGHRTTKVHLKPSGRPFKPPPRQPALKGGPPHSPHPPHSPSGPNSIKSRHPTSGQDEDVVRSLLEKEAKVLADLEVLEARIYEYETSYLASSERGNAVRGYSEWLSGSAVSPAEVRDEDRIFSRSSATGWSGGRARLAQEGGG